VVVWCNELQHLKGIISVERIQLDWPLLMNVHRFPQLQFQYRDPERGFDRRAVHGLVARLITVKDPATATALEVSAGGKVITSSMTVIA